MIKDVILIWNKYIINWFNNLNDYIIELDIIGNYNLKIKWTENVNNFNDIFNRYQDFNIKKNNIETLNYLESIVNDLNDITNNILSNEIIDKIKNENSFLSTYKKIIDYVKEYQSSSNRYISDIVNNIEKYLKEIKFDSSFNDSNGIIVSLFYIYKLKSNHEYEKIEKYKNNFLMNKEKDYSIKKDMDNIQKINYLIHPIINGSKIKNYVNISLSNKTVEYNVKPLIDKTESSNYGTIKDFNGINKNVINKFNTIIVYDNKFELNNEIKEIKNLLPIYNGYSYKYIKPINIKEDKNWYPINGVNHNVYNYNSILEERILKNMVIDENLYKNFNKKSYKTVINSNELFSQVLRKKNKLEEESYEICFSFLEKQISESKIESKTIIDELYLSQFFNIIDILKNIRSSNYRNVEIIPIKYLHFYFKLI